MYRIETLLAIVKYRIRLKSATPRIITVDNVNKKPTGSMGLILEVEHGSAPGVNPYRWLTWYVFIRTFTPELIQAQRYSRPGLRPEQAYTYRFLTVPGIGIPHIRIAAEGYTGYLLERRLFIFTRRSLHLLLTRPFLFNRRWPGCRGLWLRPWRR